MNDATLHAFRQMAETLQGPEPRDWQWVGQWESQRWFGITESRARGLAARFGGRAERMAPTAESHRAASATFERARLAANTRTRAAEAEMEATR